MKRTYQRNQTKLAYDILSDYEIMLMNKKAYRVELKKLKEQHKKEEGKLANTFIPITMQDIAKRNKCTRVYIYYVLKKYGHINKEAEENQS